VEEDDLVRKSVKTAHSLFEKVQFGRAFINGKLEITAKALLSAGWEASLGGRLAVMDKHFNRAPIDFLALENKADPAQETRGRDPGILISLDEVRGVQSIA
jgi:hypothetical protein